MPKPARRSVSKPGFVVLREVRAGVWRLIGEARRAPGATARVARLEAIRSVIGREPKSGEVYAAVLRSEWRISLDY